MTDAQEHLRADDVALDAALSNLLRHRATAGVRPTARDATREAAFLTELEMAMVSLRASIQAPGVAREMHRNWQTYASAERLAAVPRLIDAANRRNAWAAASEAMWIGYLFGFSQELPHSARGRKILIAVAEGGRTRSRQPRGASNAELQRAVHHLHGRQPSWSWTKVCQQVGLEYRLSRPTVQKRAAGERWSETKRPPTRNR